MNEKEKPAAGNGGLQQSNNSTVVENTTSAPASDTNTIVPLGDHPMAGPLIAKRAAQAYVASLRDAGLLHQRTPDELNTGLRALVNAAIAEQNAKFNPRRETGHPATVPYCTRLGHNEVAALIMARHTVVRIAPSQDQNTDPDRDLLAVYDDNPKSPRYGTYVGSDAGVRQLARDYSPDLSVRHDFPELLAALADGAPRVYKGTDRDLIPVANGIFHYRTKELLPFGPEHVFVSKLAVAYRPGATNPVIANPEGCITELHEEQGRPCTPACIAWDVESWMRNLSDDPDIVELLWQVTGAVCRPYVSWNKAAFFYAEQGNNGKGTLLHLLRQLTGTQGYASIKIADFAKDFFLEPLTSAMSVLVDENDVGDFIDKAANFKAVVTHDVIQINRKFKAPIAYQFHGFMVQCLNEKPQVRDKSQSFWRRVLAIPFTKNFETCERKYIKDDYLQRTSVLEYVLHRVLHTDYYELSAPEGTQLALEEIKDANDPIRLFWQEFVGLFAWDLLPFQFLYDLYRAWMMAANPAGKPLGRNKFIDALLAYLAERHAQGSDLQWRCDDRDQRHRSSGISGPERLIIEYGLATWVNDGAPASDYNRRSTPPPGKLSSQYRGLLRQPVGINQIATGDPTNTTSTEGEQR